jgi:hydroxymethylbilane synthase
VETLKLLAAIHDPLTAAAVGAERAFLSGLGGGCSLPVAAFAEKNNGSIILTGAVISADGKQAIRLSAVDTDPYELGERLAYLVLERGAADLLKASA